MNRPDAIFFNLAFISYLLGFFSYVFYVGLKKEKIGKFATFLMIFGFVPHTIAFITRWVSQGHYPLANMYEFIGLMAWMAVLLLVYFVYRYKNMNIGIIMSPVVVMLLVTGSLLPSDVNAQLMPALQSLWLTIHVTMAAIASGAFMIASAAAWMFLVSIPAIDARKMQGIQRQIWMMFIAVWIILPIVVTMLINAVGLMPMAISSLEEARALGMSGKPVTTFGIGGGHHPMLLGGWAIGLGISHFLAAVVWPILHKRKLPNNAGKGLGSRFFAVVVTGMLFASLISGYLIKGGLMSVTPSSYFKIFEFFGPTLVISWLTIPLSYFILVSFGGWIEKLKMPRPILEEVSYGAVAVGYPLYAVGALFAGAIWAEQAWGTWWSWDPKEVGALIVWLFYTVFLHARHNHNWKGDAAAVLVLLGMVMVFVSFWGNYFFGGMHAYA